MNPKAIWNTVPWLLLCIPSTAGVSLAGSWRGWGSTVPGPGWSLCSHMSPPQTAALALTLELAGTVWEVGLACIYRVNPAAH